jgi:hypothetical protein
MKILILSLLLLTLALTDTTTSTYTPVLAPVIQGTGPTTVYLGGQAGQTNLLFKPISVPSFAAVGTDGTVNVQPNTAGSWPISVQVFNQTSSQSENRQYILRVLPPANQSNIWALNNNNYYGQTVTNPLQVVFNSPPSIAKAGSQFNYSFQAQNGQGNLVYAFSNLPAGLIGDANTGVVSGTINNPGVYTLGCSVADQSGNQA